MGQVHSARLVWTKSSRCDSGQCVEVAWTADGVAVRDNTQPDTPLAFDGAAWRDLLRAVRAGQLDR